MAHYLNIGHIDSVFRFPSCGSVSAEVRESYSITNDLVCSSSSSIVPWSEKARKFNNVMEEKFTFSHLLIQFIERWFNQFPSLWRGFSTTTYFRHSLLLKKTYAYFQLIFAFLPFCTLEPSVSRRVSPDRRIAHDNLRKYCRLKVRHLGNYLVLAVI